MRLVMELNLMRNFMRCPVSLISTCLLAFLVLPACGGGGGGGSTAPGAFATKTSGSITALNEQSADVSGVAVSCPATGGSDTSDQAGAFDLGDLPPGIVDIHVRTPDGAGALIVKVDLRGGGTAILRISVDDDGVRRVSVERCGGDGEHNKTRAPLTAVEDGLKGKVVIGKRDNGNQDFEVEVEHLVTGRAVEVFVVDTEGLEESQGIVNADAEGEAELEIETEHGATLPHGATDVSDLEGFDVVVRDATTGADLMTGEIPALGQVPTPCRREDDDDHPHHDGDDDEGDDDHDHDHDVMGGIARLVAGPGVSGHAKAKLKTRTTDTGATEDEIEVEVEHTDITDPIEFWLEDPANAGSFVLIGTLQREHQAGEFEFELETEHGEVLPFGVAGAADLVGLAVELRNGTDASVLFTGTLPPLNQF